MGTASLTLRMPRHRTEKRGLKMLSKRSSVSLIPSVTNFRTERRPRRESLWEASVCWPPIPRPSKFLAAFANYVDRRDGSRDNLPNEFFYKETDLPAPEGTVELPDIPPVPVYQPEAELAYVMGKSARNVSQ